MSEYCPLKHGGQKERFTPYFRVNTSRRKCISLPVIREARLGGGNGKRYVEGCCTQLYPSTTGHSIRSGTGSICWATVDGSGNLSPGPAGLRIPTHTPGQKVQSGVKIEPLD